MGSLALGLSNHVRLSCKNGANLEWGEEMERPGGAKEVIDVN